MSMSSHVLLIPVTLETLRARSSPTGHGSRGLGTALWGTLGQWGRLSPYCQQQLASRATW